jgi:membrane protein implicated in regulation of membrane protease activity
MKTPTLYAETLAVLAAVAVATHFLAGVDWPWSIVAGAGVSVVLRAALRRKTPARS